MRDEGHTHALSRVFSADTPVLIIDGFVLKAERVTVVLATAGEAVIVVVEALPLIFHFVAAKVLEVAVVQLARLVQETVQPLEIEPDTSPQLTAVQKNQKLWLHSRIEVLLYQGCSITVDTDVLKVFELGGSTLVVLFDLGNNGVPLGGEIEESESRPLLVKIGDHLIERLGDLVVLVAECNEGALLHCAQYTCSH